MIWTDERYAKCLDALLPIEFEGHLGCTYEVRCKCGEFILWGRKHPWAKRAASVARLTPFEAEAILERAAREWLAQKGVEIRLSPPGEDDAEWWFDDDPNDKPGEDALYADWSHAAAEAMMAILEDER